MATLLRSPVGAHLRDTTPHHKPEKVTAGITLCITLCHSAGAVWLSSMMRKDRPDPLQLHEAHQKFRWGTPTLACLQASLVIHHSSDSWFSRMFAIEYSALFDDLIPALARAGTPIPLGGTSNHFRRPILDDLGGWDPFNVAEDADLGMRLVRAGYRTDTLTLPAYEEAPITFGASG